MKKKKGRGTKLNQEKKRFAVVRFLEKGEGTHKQAAEKFKLSKSAVDHIWGRLKKGKRVIDFIVSGIKIHNQTHNRDEVTHENIEDFNEIVENRGNVESVLKKAATKFNLEKKETDRIWKDHNNKKGELFSKKRGRKGIETDQLLEVSRIIKKSLPNHLKLKLKYHLWSNEAIQELIKMKFNIEMSRWQIARHLIDWGVAPQRLISFVEGSKSILPERWFKEEYPIIKKLAAKENAVIYFIEKTKLQGSMPSKSEEKILKAEAEKANPSPILKGKDKREKIKKSSSVKLFVSEDENILLDMISAITNKGKFHFMITKEIFDDDMFQMFLNRVKASCRRNVLFVTNLPISGAIKDWRLKNERIKVYQIPL